MAIVLNKKNVIDSETHKFVGIDLPFRKSEGVDGYFKSTDLTVDAVNQNIKILLNTNRGERVFQPTLGINLKSFLFEPISDQLKFLIQNDIKDTFNFWLPFVTITKLEIDVADNDPMLGSNKLTVNIEFFINQNPRMTDNIVVEIS